ncbi:MULTISPECIES: hypothetical protein [unclassified Cryobacterium]|uniref:hypothetical protein n=1 Tax=unclassified Cryobacterium TaxID=2649013 RepID=UPI00106946F8|nr:MULTISPECIES: hypothetical protein [unclassified Cryobacterium]TFB96284.1 hypothetical protein E3O39_09260 [Cryobacterium sp. MDB2-A-1]TFC12569.1 hypothetical protein E3O35_06425 [Cryobacterium sp. MDB2-A-2]
MKQLTSADTPDIYTAAGAGTVAVVEIDESQTVVTWRLREVADDDDSSPESEWPGGPINDLHLTVGKPGTLHGAGTIGDAELGIIRTITKLSPRVP